jgi:hypothetical protein
MMQRCHNVTAFGDHGEGEYGIYVLWDTEDHANPAAMVVRPQLNQHLAGNATTPPDARLFSVLRSM